MAQAFLETDFLVRRATPAPMRASAQASPRPTFVVNDPEPVRTAAPAQPQDARTQAPRLDRDRPEIAAQAEQTGSGQTRTERSPVPVQARRDAPAVTVMAPTPAEAASLDASGKLKDSVPQDWIAAPGPAAPAALPEATVAGMALAEVTSPATDGKDETEVAEASTEEPEASRLALGSLLPAAPPAAPGPPPVAVQGGQASAPPSDGQVNRLQGNAAQAASVAGVAAPSGDRAQPSGGADQAVKGVSSEAAGRDPFPWPSQSDVGGSVSNPVGRALPSAGPIQTAMDGVPGLTGGDAAPRLGVSNLDTSGPGPAGPVVSSTNQGQTLAGVAQPATGASPTTGALPAKADQSTLAASDTASVGKPAPKPAEQVVSSTGQGQTPTVQGPAPAGAAQPATDAVPGKADQAILTPSAGSDIGQSAPKPAGQIVSSTGPVRTAAGVGEPSKGALPGAAGQASPTPPGLSSVGKPDPAAAGKSDLAAAGRTDPSTVGKTKPSATGRTDPSTVGKTEPLATGKADPSTVGKTEPLATGKAEPSATGKTDPAVAVQDAAGAKESSVSTVVLPTPDAAHPQGRESVDSLPAGPSFGPLATAAAQTPAPAAQSAPAPMPASPPVPLGAVPMTIGLRSLQGSNHFEIRLDPGDLGRIDVRLDIDKERGTVMAHLVVDRIETLALLQRDAGSLQQALSQAGLDASEANINMSLRSDTQSGGRGAENQGSDGRRPEGRPGGSGLSHQPEGRAALDAVPLRTLSGLTGLDIRI